MAIDFKPHSYQKYAIDKVIDNEKYGLFLDMGLGKTVSTLTAFSELQLLDTKKMLVIAPKQVAKDTWVDEVDKWNHLNHLKVSLVLGTPKERNDALNTEADIYVTNKENTKWLCDQYKKEWPFDMVVIDELSTFKSPKSQRFKEATTLEDSNYKERWNSGDIKLLIAHPASAGHGLNLQQGGHIIVWFGLTWSLELYQQANARLYRQGQNHTTIIHHIMTDNTIDQRVYKALQNKELTQEELMKAIKARIAKHK